MKRRRFILTVLGAWGLPLAGGSAAQTQEKRVILIQESPLAGFQYYDGEAVWSRLRVGQALTLVREPVNRHDERAVRIEWQGYRLGYLPRVENTAVSQMLDRGEPLVARIVRLRRSHNPWERVRLAVEWCG